MPQIKGVERRGMNLKSGFISAGIIGAFLAIIVPALIVSANHEPCPSIYVIRSNGHV